MNTFLDTLGTCAIDDMTAENIAVQIDGEFTAKMDSSIEKIINDYHLIGIPEGIEASRFKELNDGLKRTSKLLEERFNLPIHLMHSNALAYVLPVTGSIGSAMDVNRGEITEYIKEFIGTACPTGNCKTKDYSRVKHDNNITNKDVIIKLNNEMKVMNKLFNKGKIEVDRTKAKVYGMLEESNKYNIKCPIGINIGALINLGATARQIVSIILHEVGHQFSFIDYSATLTRTAVSPLQSLTDNKSSDSSKRKIIIKEFGDLIDKNEDNLAELPIKLINRLTGGENNRTEFFNSEITADQFASRFGYGEEVVMALNNFHFSSERESPLISLLFLVVVVVLLVMAIMGSSMLLLFQTMALLTPMIFVTIYTISFSGMGLNLVDEHEQSYARTRRVKIEMIRMMRTSKTMPKGLKETIKDIESLDSYLLKVGQDKDFSSLLISWFSNGSKERGMHELFQRTEQLMENDLHINVAKIKMRGK